MDQSPSINTPLGEFSPVSVPEITIEARKSNTKLRMLCFIALVVGALIIPIPFRYGPVQCMPCITLSVNCPPCPQEGDIGWGPSIATQLYHQLSDRSLTTGERMVPISPGTSPVIEPTAGQPQQLQEFTCPPNGWVNCMPILNDIGKRACSSEALNWYKTNCANFQGVAQ